MVLSPTTTRHHLAKSTDGILAAADAAEPKIRRAMLDAFDALKASFPDIEDLIARGDFAAVNDIISTEWLRGPASDAVNELHGAIIRETGDAMRAAMAPEAAQFNIAFNEPNQRAIRWAEQNAAKLISDVRVDKDVVRRLVTDGLERGVHPRVTARVIRETVPILPQHQAVVDRVYRAALDSGVSQAQAEKVAARKAARYAKYRAEMIARTESIKAANMGQQVLWETAIDLDLLPAGTKKMWVATGDDRTCPICAVMDGKTVEIVTSPGTAGKFDVTRQAKGFVRSGSSFRVNGTKPYKGGGKQQSPPAHPQCRCTMITETIEAP